MSRRTVRDRWYAEVVRTRLVTGPCRELLSLMAVMHMEDRGYVKVPRDQLADELGISPHRVTVLIGQATRAGLLVKVAGGHNGQTSKYAAQVIEGCPESATFRLGRYRAESTLQRHPSDGCKEGDGCPDKAPIRARTTYKNREQQPAPDGGREEREHVLTSQAGTYRDWQPTPSKRSSSASTTAGEAA